MFFKKKETHPTYNTIALPFILLSILLAAVVFYIAFSWATVVIIPKKEHTTQHIEFRLESASSTHTTPGVLNGQIVQMTVKGEGAFSTHMGAHVTQRQSGTLTVVNKSAKDQPLRQTTRFLSQATGAQYRTESFAVVPAGGSVKVLVISDLEGVEQEEGTTHFSIPGLWPGLQGSIYGTGFTQKQSSETDVKILTQQDIDSALADIVDKAKQKTKLTLESRPSADGHSLESILDASVVSSETPGHKLSDITNQFNLTAQIRIQGVVYDMTTVRVAIQEALARQGGTGIHAPSIDPADIKILSVDSTGSGASLAIDVPIEKTLSDDMVQPLRRSLVGRSAREIREYIQAIPGVSSVEVRLYPFWVIKAPLLLDHIHILVKRD